MQRGRLKYVEARVEVHNDQDRVRSRVRTSMRIVHQVDVLGLRWLLCSGYVWLVLKPVDVHAVRAVLGRVDVVVMSHQGTRVPQPRAHGIELQVWVSAEASQHEAAKR